MVEKRPALGKGLSALIPDTPEQARSGVSEVDIGLLLPSQHQPRGQTDDAKLDDLARSIKSNGIIQPILVRRAGDQYRIIAGERRWRAAQRAGLRSVPVTVRDVVEGDDKHVLELALIENIQRENLNPIDEAQAYRRLAEEFALTQDQIAAAVGKDRSSIANTMRLLKLPDEVRAELASGTLSMGHARALLALPDPGAQRHAAREVISRGLSVRETEALIRKLSPSGGGQEERRAPKAAASTDVHTRAAEERMRFALGTKVRIVRKGQGGIIEIGFGSEAELHRLYEHLTDGRSYDPGADRNAGDRE
jgi:ParB family transcriptional regulator, chromosome partitioning protein